MQKLVQYATTTEITDGMTKPSLTPENYMKSTLKAGLGKPAFDLRKLPENVHFLNSVECFFQLVNAHCAAHSDVAFTTCAESTARQSENVSFSENLI